MDEALLKIVRSDLSDILIHWTRRQSTITAFDILVKIISEKTIIGNHGYIRGSYNCVCFTETPIADFANLFKMIILNKTQNYRYEPFGIGIKKKWLYDRGGRPVIYSSDNEYDLLKKDIQWRFMKYVPESTDYTWEREWRIKKEKLDILPDNVFVIVPTREYEKKLRSLIGNDWLILSLSTMGFPANWIEENEKK